MRERDEFNFSINLQLSEATYCAGPTTRCTRRAEDGVLVLRTTGSGPTPADPSTT
jgi:hypothetical protein